jgi:phosphohistidine phosphatase
MPTLLLMRHAKSDWGDADLPDHERPLNDRGKRDAPRMGRWIAAQGLEPTCLVTSSARRAQKTTERVVEELPCDVYVEVRKSLYLAGVEQWLEVLGDLPADAACVLCVGHNPGLEALILRLTGQSERMSTAAIACLDVSNGGWSELAAGTATVAVRAVWRPKELPEED